MFLPLPLLSLALAAHPTTAAEPTPDLLPAPIVCTEWQDPVVQPKGKKARKGAGGGKKAKKKGGSS